MCSFPQLDTKPQTEQRNEEFLPTHDLDMHMNLENSAAYAVNLQINYPSLVYLTLGAATLARFAACLSPFYHLNTSKFGAIDDKVMNALRSTLPSLCRLHNQC